MKTNHLIKLSLAAAALALGTGPLAHAGLNVPDGTYEFTATTGSTDLDGSTVTWSGDTISAWDLVDSQAASVGPWYPTTTLPLTKVNSTITSSNTYNGHPNEWDFTIESKTIALHFYDFFEGVNNEGGSALYDGFGDGTTNGTWTLGGGNSSVPDACGSIELFLGALAALATCRSFLRRESALRV